MANDKKTVAPVYGRGRETRPNLRPLKVRIYEGKDGTFYIRIVAGNGNTLFDAGGYNTRTAAQRAFHRMRTELVAGNFVIANVHARARR